MLFTAGAGFFLTVLTFKHAADQAAVTRQALLQQSALENLTLTVKLVPTGIWLSINNSGAGPSTIMSVFAVNSSGKLATTSQGASPSHYLSGKPDLNETLPLTLAPGQSSKLTSGCGPGLGCDIGISKLSYKVGQPFIVSVLTSLGNVFSVQYPAPSQGTMKNVIVLDQYVVTELLVGQSVVYVVGQSVIVGCYGCFTYLQGGGNVLVAQVVATPSPVPDDGTITVTATVWNYSPYTASAVNVTLSSLYSGSASVTPDASTKGVRCGSPGSITTLSSGVFTCTFVAEAGGLGGTVTFTGVANSCLLTGNSTTCNNGVLISSAKAGSNPVQVGAVADFGPWQLNYYYFQYADAQHTTPSSPAIIAHADTYVELSVKLTNSYNQPLTVLDGTYLQFVSPGSDVNAFILNAAPTSFGSSGLSSVAYGCVDAPPGAPVDTVSGQTCKVINPGQTVTLYFAASAPAGTSWEWGSGGNPGGASNVGCTVQIIIEFALAPSGSYLIHAQDIPFQSVFIS